MITILFLLVTIVTGIMLYGAYKAITPTEAVPGNSYQNFRSLVNFCVNTYVASLAGWLIWAIIAGFCFAIAKPTPELKYMIILFGMVTICGSLLINFSNIVLPNSNSVLRVQNNFNPIRREIVPGYDPVDIAHKYIGGLYGIKAFFEKKLGNEINTESEKSLPFTIGVTCFDDVITVKVRLFFKPARDLTDQYGSRGLTDKDRMENVQDEIDATMKGYVEELLSSHKVRDIIKAYASINQHLTNYFTSGIAGLERKTGATITSVLVTEVDQSEDGEQAHITAGNMSLFTQSANELVEASGGNLSFEKALSRAIAMAGEGTFELRQYEGFENLRGSVILQEGGGFGGGSHNPKKKTTKKKGDSDGK